MTTLTISDTLAERLQKIAKDEQRDIEVILDELIIEERNEGY